MKLRPSFLLLPLLMTLALAGSCRKADDGDDLVDVPAGRAVETQDPRLGLGAGELLADGEDQIAVTVQVTDVAGRPLVRVPVRVSTTRGAFADPNTITDFSGRASVMLTSEASATDVVAQVCAAIPEVVDSLAVIFFKNAGVGELHIPTEPTVIRLAASRPGETDDASALADNSSCLDVRMLGVDVVLSVARDEIPADGVRSTEVRAFIRQTTSGIPIGSKLVRFGTNRGRIDGELVTDADGEVRAVLRSDTSPGAATVQAFFGAGLIESAVVTFTPVSFTVDAESATLAGDGVTEAAVVATVLSQDRNPLPGLPVDFSTSIGSITSPVLTDASGRAVATLVGEGVLGQSTIIARFADVKADTTFVTFTATHRAARVTVSVAPASLIADGSTHATVTATVLDSLGGPVPDGTVVSFAVVSGGGTLVSSAPTSGGVASVQLTSATTAGSATVRASAGGVSGTAPVAYVAGAPGGVQVSATPASLIGNGIETAAVVATIADPNGNLVGPGVTVSFAADRGSITGTALTNSASQAMATYTTPVGAGTARINVASGQAQGFTTITLTSGAASQIVLLREPPHGPPPFSIGILRNGQPQSATMVFQVRSADGVPIGLANQVTVQFDLVAKTNNGIGSGEFLQPTSDVTDENGIVRTTLNSGTRPGVTKTVARIGAGASEIASEIIPISIDQDLPVVRNLTVASQLLNIEGLCFFNVRTQILALVYDQFQNPVPEGTVVYFSSQYCGIQPADTTDGHGVADDIWFISANELPPVWSGVGPSGYPYGFSEVYAQTADTNGVQIRDTTLVLLSGCSILENVLPPSFTIGSGECETFTFNLWDLNENPLTGGTRINISSTGGALSGDIDFVLPDTQDPRYTSFSFSLCDPDPADLDPPVAASISIRVTSKNGNVSTLIGGTVD